MRFSRLSLCHADAAQLQLYCSKCGWQGRCPSIFLDRVMYENICNIWKNTWYTKHSFKENHLRFYHLRRSWSPKQQWVGSTKRRQDLHKLTYVEMNDKWMKILEILWDILSFTGEVLDVFRNRLRAFTFGLPSEMPLLQHWRRSRRSVHPFAFLWTTRCKMHPSKMKAKMLELSYTVSLHPLYTFFFLQSFVRVANLIKFALTGETVISDWRLQAGVPTHAACPSQSKFDESGTGIEIWCSWFIFLLTWRPL